MGGKENADLRGLVGRQVAADDVNVSVRPPGRLDQRKELGHLAVWGATQCARERCDPPSQAPHRATAGHAADTQGVDVFFCEA